MPLAALAAALSWLGRQGTRAVAASIFIGIFLPPLAALLKPVFPLALYALLCLAFLRVDPVEVRAHFSRPVVVAAASAWMMLGTPLLIGSTLVALGMSDRLPGLYVAMILQAAAPPVISAPTLAALMGLDAALTLATLVVCTAVTPLTAPMFATLFVAQGIAISPVALGAKLLALLAGAAIVAALVRRQALELSPSRFEFDTNRLFRVVDWTLADVRTAQDAAAGKPTYPALFGLAESKKLAREAADRGRAALEAARVTGRLLDIAEWVVGRRN